MFAYYAIFFYFRTFKFKFVSWALLAFVSYRIGPSITSPLKINGRYRVYDGLIFN